MLQLTSAGINSFDVATKAGRFAGVIAWNERGDFYRVYFDSNATRGSKRKFTSVQDAVAFIRERRIRKGFSIQ
jgi:hypothetical protein